MVRLSVLCRCKETDWVEILFLVLADAYELSTGLVSWAGFDTSKIRQAADKVQHTPFGLCSIPTLKSKSKSLQSSPTLPKR